MLHNQVTKVTLFASFVCCGVAQADAFPVWVTSSLERTSPNAAAGANLRASISAAKGETESFQINVKAPSTGLTISSVVATDLVSATGQTISRNSYTFYAERYVNVKQGSPNWLGSNQPLGAGWYPDALVPFTSPITGAPLAGAYRALPATLTAGGNYVFWVDVTVPRTAAAGTYSGSITVSASAGLVVVPVSLKVWNFALPLKPAEESSFVFVHGDRARPDWYQELLRNRLNPLVVSSCATQIGSGLPGNSCAGDSQTERSLMDNFGLSMTSLRFWSGASFNNCVAPAPPSVTTINASVATQQPGLSLYNYSFDEITDCPNLSTMIPVIQQWARNLHAAGVRNLVTMSPTPAADPLFNDGTGKPAVDIWGVLPIMYDKAPAGIAKAKQTGRIWSYNDLVQDSYSPKWQIDFAPINFRIQPGFIHTSLGISGILYWSLDRWNADPWNDFNTVGAWHPTNNYPGEGTLVYPGDQVGIAGGLAPSMRLKWIRDGVDDFDYVEILKGLGQGAWATALTKTVGADWTNWTRDINALYSVRDQLGNKIDQINGGPPTAVSASPANGSGAASTFHLVYGSPNGAADLSRVSLLINSAADSRNACSLYYDAPSKSIALANDSATSWTTAALGSAAVLQNSQCSVGAASSSVLLAAGAFTWNVTVSFKSTLQGSRTLYLNAVSANGLTSGYQSMGTWTVDTSAVGPSTTSVWPTGGSKASETLQFVFTDSAGATTLVGGHILIGSAVDGRSACWMWFDRRTNSISLASDTTAAWTTALLSSPGVLQNSQCALNAAASSASVSGTALTLNLALSFQHSFAGAKQIYLDAIDGSKTAPYQSRGTWIVP